MLKKILIIFLIITSVKSFGQSYKSLTGSFQVLRIPKNVYTKDVNCVNVNLIYSSADLYYSGITKESLEDLIVFSALKKTGDMNGFKFEIKILPIAIEQTTGIRTETKESKGIKYSVYKYYFKYFIPYQIKITDPKGEVLVNHFEKSSSSNNNFSFMSDQFATSIECSNYFAANSQGFTLLKRNVSEGLGILMNSIKENAQFSIDYTPIKLSENINYFKTTKKENYDSFEKAAKSTVETFNLISPYSSRDNFFIANKSSIRFWKDTLKTLSYTNKEQVNLYAACYINLAKVYYLADELDSAKTYLEMAKKSNEKNSEIKSVTDMISYREADILKLKANGISIYGGIGVAKKELSNAELKQVFLANYLQDSKNFKLDSGYVIDNSGFQKKASFKTYNNLEPVELASKRNKTFFIMEGINSEFELNTSSVRGYKLDTQIFENVKFYTANELNNLTQQFLKVIIESNKLRVYEYDSKDLNNLASSVNLIFKKPSEEIGTNSSSAKFFLLFKKSLQNYFSDCTSMKEKIDKGEYSKNRQGILKAANDYINCN